MIQQPKVSIIIPVYNGTDYLEEAIDSALAQDYPNVEVIVVNDGSSDEGKTDRLCKKYGDRIIYHQQVNGGVGSALNKGISLMEGDYFSWLSHDDLYTSKKISRQMERLQKSPFSIVYCGYELINEKSMRIGEVNPLKLYQREKLEVPLFPLLTGIINGCTLLIHKSLFIRHGTFDTELKTTQDYSLWFEMLKTEKILFCDELLVKSRVHKNQGSKTITSHVDECNRLWIGFLVNTPEECIRQLSANRYLFYKSMATLLESTGYQEAKVYADRLYKEELMKNPESGTDSDSTALFSTRRQVNKVTYYVESIMTILKSHGLTYLFKLVIKKIRGDKQNVYR